MCIRVYNGKLCAVDILYPIFIDRYTCTWCKNDASSFLYQGKSSLPYLENLANRVATGTDNSVTESSPEFTPAESRSKLWHS